MSPNVSLLSGFPTHGCTSDVALKEIERYLVLDHRYSDGRVFNSICSQPLPVGIAAFERAIASNLGDPRVFPGSAALERQVIAWIGQLLSSPTACGNLVSGGTEANLLALLAARARHRALHGPMRGPLRVVAPMSLHFSFDKAADVLGIEVVHSRLDKHYCADVADLEAKLDENTIAVIATAGTSELGAVDDVTAIAAVAEKRGIYCHVDAASGAFIIPFAKALGYSLPAFDFGVPHVNSITVDPHKYGLAPIPSGCIMFRSEHERAGFEYPSHYIGTPAHTTLTGTRAGAAAAATAAVIRQLGRDGFIDLTEKLFNKREHLVANLRRRGWQPLMRPQLTIVAVPCAEPQRVLEALEHRGWIVSLSKRNSAIRIVVHHHLDMAALDAFVDAFCTVARPIENGSHEALAHIC